MANVTVFDISGGRACAISAEDITAAQEVQTVPVGKDSRLALRVANGNAAAVIVRIKAGDGPRAPLGDYDVTVGGGAAAYIALYDTARYKSGGVVTVHLMADEDTPLGAEQRVNVSIEAVQL
ncbi:MAG: hypothetical protein GXW96_12515 [Christensenellaceae bacterium]|nr:hypothetical protein [Christensenellaceae bacterium]